MIWHSWHDFQDRAERLGTVWHIFDGRIRRFGEGVMDWKISDGLFYVVVIVGG